MKRTAIFLSSVLTFAAAVVASETTGSGRSLPAPPEAVPAAPQPAASKTPSPAPVPPPRRGFTLADLKAQVPQNKDGTFQMEVPAILNTSTDREVQALLTGQSVETTGQVMPESLANADGKSLRVTRSQLLCCAEHARQCSLALQFFEKAPTFKKLAWVTLTGTISYKQEDGKAAPVIHVKAIKEIAAPKNPLLQ